ncbi:MAG: NUDIX domain-containing protein [Spirochaetales bacterium]|nr:NUDIX domain-containing protein [Spirochaetales bacterium]
MEVFDRVDADNRVIGKALRSDCHGNPSIIHRAVHVLVVNRQGRVLVQKRSMNKDVQPGKWDTSVGGHLNAGESYEDAAVRESREELGLEVESPLMMYEYLLTNSVESEWVRSYCVCTDGPFSPCPVEIDDISFLSLTQISNDDPGRYTPNFIEEIVRFGSWVRKNRAAFAACIHCIQEEMDHE